MSFTISADTRIVYAGDETPVKNAVRILKRDINKVCSAGEKNEIVLKPTADTEPETFTISVNDGMSVTAGDALGFVYGLLYISERFLGIKPFWFWLDQRIENRGEVVVKNGEYTQKKPVIKYRGWFFNDEVLIMKWSIGGDPAEPWRMAFEALLRCGGNMTIPGTDKNSRKYRRLASDMGLMITHHHAEPLGAEMFLRAYPDKNPSYDEYPELFEALWEDAVKEQKDMNVIWNLGFRGQGDCPFWAADASGKYDTDEKRGALISSLIEKQRQIVLKYVPDAKFCTNLYGEIMELYNDGFITLDPDIIKIYADNGFGKMVARRRGNHSKRVEAMPKKGDGASGIYYHVSFYDLQAANHITMLPNSVDFVDRELSKVIESGGDDFWIINCSNVRPHAYYLDAVRKKWFGESVSDAVHSKDFAADYYGGSADAARCLEDYTKALLSYGENEDEHCGEQFYTENTRIIVNRFICDRTQPIEGCKWFTGEKSFDEQVKIFCKLCSDGLSGLLGYYNECKDALSGMAGDNARLFESTVLLQAKIHYFCARGVSLFGKGYGEYLAGELKAAFMSFGYSYESFKAAADALRKSEYGVWKGFYSNDCFADIKHTAYMVKKMMGVIREYGDNAHHVNWYRDAVYAPEDRYILTLLVNDNHMEDLELFEAMKAAENNK